ncbi:MAG: Ca-activated chloride channel [Acidobacteriota bacterium]|jgi:Ca-activated chloride channel family protein
MRILILLGVAATLRLVSAVDIGAQDPVFRSGARTVAVYVTVSDAQGRIVPDLTREDFEVYDNGKPQTITLFESGVQPITIVLMLDRSGSMISNFRLVRSAAEQFVSQLLPGDKARIGSFSNRIQLDPQTFTSSKRDLIEILRTELQDAGPTPLWNAVNVAITALQHQEGRRVILMFTDGIDRPMNSHSISLNEVMKNAEEHDVMVFTIGLESRSYFPARRGGVGRGPSVGAMGTPGGVGQPPEFEKPDAGLPRIALATGGGYFELTSANNLGATFTRVADELHRQYSLGFTPAAFDGKTHRLEVRVRRPGLKPRARKTYVARPDVL